MTNRIDSRMPRLLYATVAAAILTGGPARAADDCLAAPSAAAPQGSHWYYRIDRPQARHCWYLGPQGQQIRHAAGDAQPTAKSAVLSSQQIEPPLPLPRPASLSRTTPEAGIEGIAEPAQQGVPSAVQSPDPDQRTGLEFEAGSANLRQDVSADGDLTPPNAPTAVNARAMTLSLILLLIASAASAAIMIHPMMFRIAARRRRAPVKSGRTGRTAGTGNEKAAPIAAPRPDAATRPRAEPIDLPGLEEGIRQIVRTVQRRAA
jgi:hypothetical protein